MNELSSWILFVLVCFIIVETGGALRNRITTIDNKIVRSKKELSNLAKRMKEADSDFTRTRK